MSTSFDVARQLVELASREPEPEALTPFRLQKLVYYCQGWALALLGTPLFLERIEAWKNGPVAVDLYQRLKENTATPIALEQMASAAPLPELSRSLVAAVWERYKGLSATGLWQKTHSERPWLEARAGLPADAECAEEIAHQALASFFSAELNKEAVDGITPAQSWNGYRDVLEGRVHPKTEVFARLRGTVCLSS